jgi:hypothetical protein
MSDEFYSSQNMIIEAYNLEREGVLGINNAETEGMERKRWRRCALPPHSIFSSHFCRLGDALAGYGVRRHGRRFDEYPWHP